MYKYFFLQLLAIPLISMGQDYKVSSIPDSLKENANIVKRIDQTQIIIKDFGKAYIHHKWAYTILNEAGNKVALYKNYYDKFHNLSDITGKMYDSIGNLLKSVKKKDIADLADNDEESLISDSRRKVFAFYNKAYPYTVEFEDEVERNGIYNLENWFPVEQNNLSVQQSSLQVETPVNYHLRYKQFCYNAAPTITTDKDKITYLWQIANQKAIQEEILQPPINEIMPTVFLAPTNFEMAGYSGNMETWNSLGKFNAQLNLNRQTLPDNIKQQVHKLTDELNNEEDKVKILYQYLQNNTRYINVSLGIGGWQPFDAAYVAKNKYGDCKALTNYMVSLLKEAGIKANYALIFGDDDLKGVYADFPMHLFNHVVCCVPLKTDTIWLECTSQTRSAGYMGTFTGDRLALLIDDDGGHLVHTPTYGMDDNIKIRKINATIDEDGNLIAEINTHFSGIAQEASHSIFHDGNKDEQEKYFNRSINLPTYKVEKIEFKETKNKVPAMDEYLKLRSDNYATIMGKRLIVRPDIINVENKMPSGKQRQFDILIPYSYKEIDSIDIVLPEKYTVESLPKNVTTETKFGKYSVNYKISNDKIEMVRLQTHNAVQLPATEYDDLVKFYDFMYKTDHAKIAFIKPGE